MGIIHGIQTNFDVGDILFSHMNNHYLVIVFVQFDSVLDDVNSYAIKELDFVCICSTYDEAIELNIYDTDLLRSNEMRHRIIELMDYMKHYNNHVPLIPIEHRNHYAVLNDL